MAIRKNSSKSQDGEKPAEKPKPTGRPGQDFPGPQYQTEGWKPPREPKKK